VRSSAQEIPMQKIVEMLFSTFCNNFPGDNNFNETSSQWYVHSDINNSNENRSSEYVKLDDGALWMEASRDFWDNKHFWRHTGSGNIAQIFGNKQDNQAYDIHLTDLWKKWRPSSQWLASSLQWYLLAQSEYKDLELFLDKSVIERLYWDNWSNLPPSIIDLYSDLGEYPQQDTSIIQQREEYVKEMETLVDNNTRAKKDAVWLRRRKSTYLLETDEK